MVICGGEAARYKLSCSSLDFYLYRVYMLGIILD